MNKELIRDAFNKTIARLEATFPCSHGSSDTNLGAGDIWACCNDCGESFKQVDWPKFKANAREHQSAISAVKAALAELDKAEAVPLALTEDDLSEADIARILTNANMDTLFSYRRCFRLGTQHARRTRRSVTINAIMECVKAWVKASGTLDSDVVFFLLPEEKAAGVTKYEADLRARLQKLVNP